MTTRTVLEIVAVWFTVALVLAPLVGAAVRRNRLREMRRQAQRHHTAYPHFLPGERLP